MVILSKLCGRFSAHLTSNLLRNSSAIPKVEPEIHEKKPCAAVLNSTPCQLLRTWNHGVKYLANGSTAHRKLHCRSGDPALDEQIRNWLEWDRNPETISKIKAVIKAQDWDALRACLCHRMKFGAEGLLAKMDAGFNAMNDLVVIQTAQGLCAYLKKKHPDMMTWCKRGIVIGYDARHNSKRFAKLTAGVFLSNNFRVYLFRCFVPTPFIPFTILRLKCLGGVMVTASQYPKEQNGYKIYWSNGAEITTEHETCLSQCIMANLEPQECSWNESVLEKHELLFNPYRTVVPAYFEALKREIPCPLLIDNCECPVTFTYTPMHGVGFDAIDMAFPKMNLEDVKPVEEQVKPDPDFSTIPNLEDSKTAMQLAMESAIAEESDIILANNPDATGLIVAELGDEGEYKLFTGSELAALLGWWTLEMYSLKAGKPELSKCVMLSTSVSSQILKSMAAVEKFTYHETTKGFKWIASKALEEQKAGKQVLFAFEEPSGYMVSTNVPERDGISAAVHVGTMVCYLRCKKCMSLQDKLRDIYEKYGFHYSVASHVECKDVHLMQNIFKGLRNFSNKQQDTYPKCILKGEFEVEHVNDLTTGFDSCKPDKRGKHTDNPSTQMITFTFKNGFVITLCSSVTEPNLKYFAEMVGKPEDKRWDELEKNTKRMVDAVVNEFYDPKKNCLPVKTEN